MDGACSSRARMLSFGTALLISTVTAFEPARGVTITPSTTWYQFSWFGEFVEGCRPADPNGGICVPSSNGDSIAVGVPPWEFTAPTGVRLDVTDMANYGADWYVLDGGVAIGRTSQPAPVNSGSCGYSANYCFADPNVSHASFILLPGFHSITLDPITFTSGAAMFRVVPIPEPSTGLLVMVGLFGLGQRSRGRA